MTQPAPSFPGVLSSPRARQALFRVLLPLILAVSVWWPDYDHYRIDRSPPTPTLVADLQAHPRPTTLEEVAAMTLLAPLGLQPEERLPAARRLLEGFLDAPAYRPEPLPLRGWPADLEVEGSTFQLLMASLTLENLLLDEFEAQGDRRFYRLARDRILAFAAWEEAQRRPTAFLWNDHAVAARIAVLVHLWRHLREDPEARPEDRAALVALVARSGELLAKPDHFTVRSNHGVMQNLALLQIGAAFPDLPQAAAWRHLAQERLDVQLAFYVSPEGVILEHSAGYHVFGTELLDHALRLTRLNGLDPSLKLAAAAVRSSSVNRLLARPDSSLPLFGNTAAHALVDYKEGRGAVSPASPEPPQGAYLYPLAGYALWWSGGAVPSQTVVAWAKHERHGHKHADEPSLHFWSRGRDWITAAGYWPYEDPGYRQAVGWAGANAPHLVDEPAHAGRQSRLLASGENGDRRLVDVENRRDQGFSVRRQVLQLAPETLLVLDFIDRARSPVETLWTLDPRLDLQGRDGRYFAADGNGAGPGLHIALTHPGALEVGASLRRGSRSPFGGWVVVGRRPTPAPALVVEQKAPGGVTAALFAVGAADQAATVKLEAGARPDTWLARVDGPAGPMKVERQGNTVIIDAATGRHALSLDPSPLLAPAQEALEAALSEAMERYPPWRNLEAFRGRVYLAAGLLWLALEIVLLLLVRRGWWKNWMNAGNLAVWLGFGFLVHSYYLA